MAIRIACIITDRDDPTHPIAGVGDGFGWTEAEQTVIAEIEDGANYYVEVEGRRVPVTVGERAGCKYLRTDPEGGTENHLLHLPVCPVR